MMSSKIISVRFQDESIEKIEQRIARLGISRSLYLEVCQDMIDRYFPNDAHIATEVKMFKEERTSKDGRRKDNG